MALGQVLETWVCRHIIVQTTLVLEGSPWSESGPLSGQVPARTDSTLQEHIHGNDITSPSTILSHGGHFG